MSNIEKEVQQEMIKEENLKESKKKQYIKIDFGESSNQFNLLSRNYI